MKKIVDEIKEIDKEIHDQIAHLQPELKLEDILQIIVGAYVLSDGRSIIRLL